MAIILVVDDDGLVRSSIQAWILAMGHEVFVADGAVSGLKALDENVVDVMVVDIFMPHMHGLESVETFHRRAPLVPLIAISGYVFLERRVPAPDFLQLTLKLGASHCLRKPFTPKALHYAIEDCLAKSNLTSIEAICTGNSMA